MILVALRVIDASAQVCSVPTLAYPSIQEAVDDAACAEVVLAAQDFAGSVAVSRSLMLRGASSTTTTIFGQVTVTGASTEASGVRSPLLIA